MDNSTDNVREFFERRKFLKKVWQFFALGSAALLSIILGMFYSRFLQKRRRFVYSLDELSETINIQPDICIVKEDERITVLSRKCPHLGCTLELNQSGDGFVCPCHGSRFRKDGGFIEGPAKKNMQKLDFSNNGSVIEISL